MKNKYFAAIFTLLILLGGLTENAFAQQGQISFSNGIAVSINTVQSQVNFDLANIYTSSGNDKNIVHRVMIDRKNKIYFGYDLEIIPTADTSAMEVLIKPPTLDAVRSVVEKIGGVEDLSLRDLPKYPDKLTIQSGDTIILNLLENPQTKGKISDSITIKRGTQKNFFYNSGDGNLKNSFSNLNSGVAKDFSIKDVQMSLNGFDAYVNNEKVKFSGGGMFGSVLWVYFPNKGRFIFSPIAQNNSGFRKIGLIDEKNISFDYDGASYKFVSNNPILTGGGKWNLWVMFDGDYKSSADLSAETPFSFGATNKVEYLFDNR